MRDISTFILYKSSLHSPRPFREPPTKYQINRDNRLSTKVVPTICTKFTDFSCLFAFFFKFTPTIQETK